MFEALLSASRAPPSGGKISVANAVSALGHATRYTSLEGGKAVLPETDTTAVGDKLVWADRCCKLTAQRALCTCLSLQHHVNHQ